MHTVDSSHISAIKVLEHRAALRGGRPCVVLILHFWLYSTLLPEPWAATYPVLAHIMGISPLRGSLRAAFAEVPL